MNNGAFHHFVLRYFANHLSRPLKELYGSTAILTFATSAVTIFEPIYLFRVGVTLPGIFLFYLVVYVGYLLALPLGAKVARGRGYEQAILFSSPFLILYYLALAVIPVRHEFLFVAVVAFIIQKILYWPAYHADFAHYGMQEERGRQITTMGLLLTIVGLAGPVLGGAVISLWGFRILFLIVAILVLVSNIPMLVTPEPFTPVAFSYRDAWRRLLRHDFRKRALGNLGTVEDLTAMVGWPLFIFTVIPAFIVLGAIVSAASLLTSLLLLIVGRLTDTHDRRRILRIGVVFTTLSWLTRPLLASPVGVFVSDFWYRLARSFIGIPVAATVYDRAKDGGVMDTVVSYEMALAFGKAVGSGIGLVLVLALGSAFWMPFFVVSAIATLLYGLLI